MYKYIVVTMDKRKKKCTGPYQLEEWLKTGTAAPDSRVLDTKTQIWDTAENTLKNSKKRTSHHYIDECEQTLTDLNNVADEIRKILEARQK
tara:strand:- start:22290 stop:22562 length:273 start_codon:yes stop_codon:yes gene_type:complete